MDRAGLAAVIEQSLLGSKATHDDIRRLCEGARQWGFRSVCVNPSFVRNAVDELEGSGVKVVTVIGFPLGATLPQVKIYEAIECALHGADELDVVINVGRALSGDWDYVGREFSDVISATPGLVHKAIIEAPLLGRDEKRRAVEECIDAGASYVKTSTGFAGAAATADDVRLMKDVSSGRAGIKAAGGIRSLAEAIEMLKAGADLIGTSRGVEMMQEPTQES